ncbi:hypothetical protein ABPG74_013664 [Tetrahymena malaccensis]
MISQQLTKLFISVINFFLFSTLLVNGRQILTQFQSGYDDSTIKNPIKSPGQTTVDISFQNSYSGTPQVLIYLTSISVQKTNLQDYKVEATSITSKGFQILYTVQFNAETVSLGTSWIAFEQTSEAEVIYQEVNGINLANSALQQTFRFDTFPIIFKNNYTSIPNVAVFFLGVSSLQSSTDTVSINYADAQTNGCSIAISAWNSGLVNKASFALLVVNQNMSISQYGSQNNYNGGSIDITNPWMDSTQSNRVLQKTQVVTKNLSPSTDANSKIISISGFTGYDVRSNLFTNLKISASTFSQSIFSQSVETWGQSQVVGGFWYSVAINTTVNNFNQSDSGLAWWIILIIVLAILIVIILVVLLIICLERRKRKEKEALEEKNQNINNKEESINDISKNEVTKNQDISNINKNLSQDNTNSIMIKDRNYVDDYIPHKENPNTKRDADNIFLNNTQFISPKNSSTETNLDQSKKIVYLGGNVEYSPTPASNQKSQQVNQQNSKQQSSIQYYQNPRKQYEIVNNYQDEENRIVIKNNSNNNQQASVQNNNQTLPSPNVVDQKNQSQDQKDQNNAVKELQKQVPNQNTPQNQDKINQQLQNQQTSSNSHQEQPNNNQIHIQSQDKNEEQKGKPIDKTLDELDKHINNYKKDQVNQSLNQSQISQEIEQNDEMKQIKFSNYDVYRQILLNKQNFDRQQTNQPAVTSKLPQNVSTVNDNYQNNNPNNSNHILNNRYNLDKGNNNNSNSNNNISLNNNNSSNNFYSNSSTYRPLQYSSRQEDLQQQNQNNTLPNIQSNSLSQAGNMIVNGYGNQASPNKSNPSQKKEIDLVSQQKTQPVQYTQKDHTLNTVDSVYKHVQQSLYTNPKGSDFLSVEDDDDMPRRPKDNNNIPNI